jgi:hypothetical protein
LPALKDRHAYWPMDRWDVQRLDGDRLERFRTCFDQHFWSTIPPLEGAVAACRQLSDAGYELICVSAVPEKYRDARLQNIRDCGFPIESVIATPHASPDISPKATALHALQPLAFVDDYLPYLRGIPTAIHAALIMREPNGSPNVGDELVNAHSTHSNLLDFAEWWLQGQSHDIR